MGTRELTLEWLNAATQAWVELEYHWTLHTELGCAPLERYLAGPVVGRPSPSSDDLRRAFRVEVSRTQRKSDGTILLEGRRFEGPGRYRHLAQLRVCYARWELRTVDLIDPHPQTLLATLYPLDKTANADGQRRRLALPPPPALAPPADPPPSGIAPLLRKLMADYAATGLPPAHQALALQPDSPQEESPPS